MSQQPVRVDFRCDHCSRNIRTFFCSKGTIPASPTCPVCGNTLQRIDLHGNVPADVRMEWYKPRTVPKLDIRLMVNDCCKEHGDLVNYVSKSDMLLARPMTGQQLLTKEGFAVDPC